jgi:hypothetical protein
MHPRNLLSRLEQLRRERPFRHLGRRLVQAVTEAAGENPFLSRRSAPGRYSVLRLVESPAEREHWEALFAEGRTALLEELKREAAAREILLRGAPDVELLTLLDGPAARAEAERLLGSLAAPEEVARLAGRLHEERELILPRPSRALRVTTTPPGAALYLEDRPAGVTPCTVEDLPAGEHRLALSLPGYLLHEDRLEVSASDPRRVVEYTARLTPEPPMGVLEVTTYPPDARVTINGETRVAPTRFRLPAGPVHVRVELPDYAPLEAELRLPPTTEERPFPWQARLEYAGPDRDVVVGRLQVYAPGARPTGGIPTPREPSNPVPASHHRIRDFFADPPEAAGTSPAPAPPEPAWEWDLPSAPAAPAPPEHGLLGERPLARGILLIGREDPGGGLQPDIRLFDAENSVRRGCHAWLWIYADQSTGGTYNTFLVGNNSPAGIRVDGETVMGTRALSGDSLIEVGNFTLRLVKEEPAPRVEFGF